MSFRQNKCVDKRIFLSSPAPPVHMLLLGPFHHVRLFVTLWTAACQAPLSMGFSRQEYQSGLPFPAPGDLPDPGIDPSSPASPALQADSSLLRPDARKWNRALGCELAQRDGGQNRGQGWLLGGSWACCHSACCRILARYDSASIFLRPRQTLVPTRGWH